MRPFTVAAAQIECAVGDIKGNLALHLDAIATARRRGVSLLLFPELSLTDYTAGPRAEELACELSTSAEIDNLARAAGEMMVSFGVMERNGAALPLNTQVLVHDGRLLHAHRKLNLPHYGKLVERSHFSPAEQLQAARIDGLTISTLTCADSWNPALVWLTAHQAPDLLLQPVASAHSAAGEEFDNPTGWEMTLRHNAMIYSLPTVFCNHCGRRDGLAFWGGSRILDTQGRDLARAGEDAALIVAEIDLDHTPVARRILPTVEDSNPALIARLLAQSGLGARPS